MASAKDLKKRITSVKNTQQITRAMKLVAASKLRRAQEGIQALRPYALDLGKIIRTVSRSDAEEVSNDLLRARDVVKSCLVVVVTSDRGLCGGFNGNVSKAAYRFLRESGKKYEKIDFAYVGKKGYEFFKEKKPGKYYNGFFVKLDAKKSADLAQELIQLYLDGQYDEIKVAYNEFKSVLVQKVNVEHYLPVQQVETEDKANAESSESLMAIFEPNAKTIINEALPRHFAIQLHRVMLESIASEYAARMTAMESATKNAGEMIKKLSLQYNKTRQAGITKELLEIVSGAEAQKS